MNPTESCGRSIEDLSDYLETGISTDFVHIENCPQCQARLAGLRSLGMLAQDLLHDDIATASEAGWLDSVVANLRLETRAGRSIPLDGGALDTLTETEGAVIAMIRAVGDSLGGVLIGRCRLAGEVTVAGAPVEVNIDVSTQYGYRLPTVAQELRSAVLAELLVHSDLNVVAVNVAFTGVRAPLDGAVDEGEAQ